MKRRKNMDGGSHMSRKCWCVSNPGTCPVQVLWPFFAALPDGVVPFAGISAGRALKSLRQALRLFPATRKESGLYRCHDLLWNPPNTTPQCAHRRAIPPRDRAAIGKTARRAGQAGEQEGKQGRKAESKPARQKSQQTSKRGHKTRQHASGAQSSRASKQASRQARKQASKPASKEGGKQESQNPQLMAGAERARDVDNWIAKPRVLDMSRPSECCYLGSSREKSGQYRPLTSVVAERLHGCA